MLPRETSIRQLKKLRAETKGKDIGDLTTGDRLNHNIPNLQYIGNPVDTGIESWEEFSKKDSKLQTIAFKSKLVNKHIKENKKENMKDIKTFENFENSELDSYTDKDLENIRQGKIIDDDENDEYNKSFDNDESDTDRQDIIDVICANIECDKDEIDHLTDEELFDLIHDLKLDLNDDLDDDLDDDFPKGNMNVEEDYYESLKESFSEWYAENKDSDDLDDEYREYRNETDPSERLTFRQWCKEKYNFIAKYEGGLDENVKTFENFTVKDKAKEEKQPDYTILGKEKELKSNPNFGIGAVKAQEIKKITDFNVIDPKTPKERSILNAGQFIDNDIVKGYVNRIEGKDVYVESLEDPLVIKKFNIKDAVKLKKE